MLINGESDKWPHRTELLTLTVTGARQLAAAADEVDRLERLDQECDD